MKAEVKENEVVKHWGIWSNFGGGWMVSNDMLIFAVTCPRVANAQYDILIKQAEKEGHTDLEALKNSLEVKEIT